jgi:hypothetical protein
MPQPLIPPPMMKRSLATPGIVSVTWVPPPATTVPIVTHPSTVFFRFDALLRKTNISAQRRLIIAALAASQCCMRKQTNISAQQNFR